MSKAKLVGMYKQELSLHLGSLAPELTLFFFFIIFFNIYSFLRDRERQSVSRGGAEREGDTESEAGSRL